MPKRRRRRHREYIGDKTRLVHEIPVDGFVVKPEDLQRLHATIADCELFEDDDSDDGDCAVRYRAFLEDGSVVQFRDLAEVLNYPNTSPSAIEGLRMSRLSEGQQKVEVELGSSGEVIVDACGLPRIVEGTVHTMSQQLRAVDQEFSWFARFFVLSKLPRILFTMMAVTASSLLLFLLGYYFLALNIGVDVGPDLIPRGMSYFQRVEEAIRSQDATEKLDVLLLGEFRGFQNFTEVLREVRNLMKGCILAIVILGPAAWVLRHLKRYYPPAFFSIGYQTEVLARIVKGRELWTVGIVVAFVVNLVAGIVVAFAF